MTKKAIVIGASSGIGKELAVVLAENGYEVGLMARRLHLLKELQEQIPTKTYIGYLDISQPEEAIESVKEILEAMGDVDLIVVNSGASFSDKILSWESEKQTLDVNVYGFCAMASLAFRYFCHKKKGHLVGISSIGALRGYDKAPAYTASKAFVSNYLEGLRKRAFKKGLNLVVTDVKPGFVETEMMRGTGHFWVASPRVAAEQIYRAIKNKKNHVYITRRWRLIAWLMKFLPTSIYNRM